MHRHRMSLLTLFVAGCVDPHYFMMEPIPRSGAYPSDYIVRIESDATYAGFAGHQDVSGFSTKSYFIFPGECYSIRKTSTDGYLRVFITYAGYFQGSNYPKWNDRATTGFYSITGCL